MKEATARQIESMKAQTIGVEVEMYGISRRAAASTAAEYFGTSRFEDTDPRNGYRAWSAWDAQGREWKFQRDVSIDAANESQQCELVTPILHYEDIELLQGLLRSLRHAGAKSNPGHMCGVHIHIGAAGHTAKTLRNLANLMAGHESLLIAAMRLDHGRISRYCRTVDQRFLEALNKKKPAEMNQLADLWYGMQGFASQRHAHYNGSRYHMLNLHATFTKGTVEFRLFNGTLHAGEIKAYIQFCLAMTHQALTQKKASARKTETDNEKYAFRCWMLRLGLIGDEFKTCRHHLLKNLTGNAAWRHAAA